MRYYINFEKTINQLVPHFIGGRKLILYLQSITRPLQTINDKWVEYAKETKIDISATSQIMYFEWYLNRKMSKYFKNKGSIVINNTQRVGTIIYHESANIKNEDNIALLKSEEDSANNTAYFRYHGEGTGTSEYSFIVCSPEIDTSLISNEEYEAMLSYYIDKYKLSGKTYKIFIN